MRQPPAYPCTSRLRIATLLLATTASLAFLALGLEGHSVARAAGTSPGPDAPAGHFKPRPTSTPRPTATPRPSPTPTPKPTTSPSPTPSLSPTPTATPRPSATPSPSPTASATPTASPTPSPTPAGGRRVVGYFPLWAPNGGYTARDIDWRVVTHVAHFSVVPLSDGRIQIPDWGPFPDPLLLSTAHANGARVSLVVGGDHAEATQGFAAMSASATTRRTFITNLLSLVTTNGYDGVDLDWEFPASSADRTNLTALVQELRTALGTARTLSIAAPASDWNGQWFDIPGLVPSLDWIGAMTYALAAPSWSPNAYHSSPLYTNGSPFSVEATRTYYLGRGVPAAKLLVGVPFYGERFDGAADILQPLTNRLGGDMTYPDIAALSPTTWVSKRDGVAQVPYLVRTDAPGVITYDDATSVAAKCAYARQQGLGGVIVWHLGQDRIGTSQPLLAALTGCR